MSKEIVLNQTHRLYFSFLGLIFFFGVMILSHFAQRTPGDEIVFWGLQFTLMAMGIFIIFMVVGFFKIYLSDRKYFITYLGKDYFDLFVFENYIHLVKKRFYWTEVKNATIVKSNIPHIYIDLKSGEHFVYNLKFSFMLQEQRKVFISYIEQETRERIN